MTLDEIILIAFVRSRYRVGLTGAVLEYAAKKYKSH